MHHHDRRIGVEPRDAHELLARIDRRAAEQFVHLGRARDADQRNQQRVTVGRRVGDDLRAGGARRARPVLDHDRLLEHTLQRRRKRPCGQISNATRRKRHDQGDGPRRVFLRQGGQRDQCGQQDPEQTSNLHGIPPLLLVMR